MTTWTQTLADWANKAISVARMNAYFGQGGNLDHLLLRTNRCIATAGEGLTIAGGDITISPTINGEGLYTVDTENGDQVDTLASISPSINETLHDGDIIYLLAADFGRIIMLGDSNIYLPSNNFNIALSAIIPLGLRYSEVLEGWTLLGYQDPYAQLWQNNSGSYVEKGDVVVFDKSAPMSFTTSAVAGDRRILGVVLDSSIGAGNYGWIATGGIRQVSLNGAVSVGDALIPSGTVKLAAPNGGAVQDGYIGYVVDATGSPTFCLAQIAPKTDQTSGQISFVSATGATISYGGTFSVAVSGNNRALVVIAAYYGSGNLTTITYGGVGMTQQSLTGNGQPQLGIWTLVAPTVGTADVQVNATSGAHIRAVAIVLNDVNQSTPFGTVATGTSTSDNPSVVVDTTPGDYAIGAFVINSDTAGTPSSRGGGQSILDGPTVGINGSVASTETDSIDTVTGNSAAFTWTCPSSALWLAAGIAVKPL